MNSLRNVLRGLTAALANASVDAEELDIPKYRYDGELITSAAEVASALGVTVIEAKARIRRVRTAAGVRKYGQPIGSVITEDLVPHSQLEFVPGKPSDWTREMGPEDPPNTKRYRLRGDDDDYYRANIVRRPGDGKWTLNIYDKRRDRQIIDEFNTFEAAKYAFEKYRDRQNAQVDVRRVKPTSKKRFVDQERWGVYGKDWWYETEDEADLPEWDEESIRARQAIARHATEQMGITIDVVNQSKRFNLHPKYHEVFNQYMMAQQETRPGLVSYITHTGTATTPSLPTAMAYNTIMFDMDERGIPIVTNDRTTGVFFNPKLWGADAVRPGESVAASGQEGSRFWSVRESAMRRFADLDNDQRVFLFTTTHEVGHTVARMVAFDELTGSASRLEMSEEDRLYYRQMFWYDVSTIMENHGLGDSYEIYNAMVEGLGDRNGVALPTSKMQDVLSRYGATNLHELLAEVWAEYELDPEPRSFAAEVGSVMENVLDEWLYWHSAYEEE